MIRRETGIKYQRHLHGTFLQKLQNGEARVLSYSNYDVDGGHLFKTSRVEEPT